MPMPIGFKERLRLPAICAPMNRVSTPALVIAACKAGIIGAIPRNNASSIEEFESWLVRIRSELDAAGVATPVAVNLSTRLSETELELHLSICARHGVEIIVSATGDPTTLIHLAKAHGLFVLADAVNLRFADKAIAAGVDGIVAIGAGGGGHSGTINHLTLVDAIRRRFDGMVVMAGAITNGRAVRAAQILGADMAYLGTRFIATQESGASPAYKDFLVSEGATDLVYTPAVNGVAANWLKASIRSHGLDPDALPPRALGSRGHAHLPEGVRPWENLWSAGQGVEAITDVPSVAELVDRLEQEYRQACEVPFF